MGKQWSFLFGAVMAACLLLFIVAPIVGWWMPKNVSSYGQDVDNLYYLILGFTGFFFILTEAILVYNMYRFAGREGHKADYVHGNHRLEIVWTIVPAAILIFIAFTQIRTWEDIKYKSRFPKPEQILEISARQFEWRIRYPQDITPKSPESWDKTAEADDLYAVNELHVWKGANVKLYLKTRDVLHSFFLPNLRIKQDAVPGKTIPVWFQPTEANCKYNEQTQTWDIDKDNHWELACAELCGWGHYKMQGKLVVHADKADFERWMKKATADQNARVPTP